MYTYSQRLSWSFTANRFSRLIADKRKSGISLLDLTISNPTTVLAGYPHFAISRIYAGLNDFTFRPDPLGRLESRLAIVEFYKRRAISISPEQILFTGSTSEAYSFLFKLLLNPGEEVLVPAPSYPLFEYLAALDSVRIVPYRLVYDGNWFIDFMDVARQISSRTRAIVVVNPNNPTGSVLKTSEADRLFDLALQHRLPIISDEVFMDYALDETAGAVKTFIGHDAVLSFSLNGLSKSAGMPQMKLAWIAINGPEQDREIARHALELIIDTYLSVGTPVEAALPGLLEIGEVIQQEIRARIAQNWKIANEILNNSPAKCLHAEGGWSGIIQLPRTFSEEQWITRLVEEQAVIVQPGYFFDMPSEAYVVVNLITRTEEFVDGLRRIRQLLTRD